MKRTFVVTNHGGSTKTLGGTVVPTTLAGRPRAAETSATGAFQVAPRTPPWSLRRVPAIETSIFGTV